MRAFRPVAVVTLTGLMLLGIVPSASATVPITVDGISYQAEPGDVAAGATVIGYSGGAAATIPSVVSLDGTDYAVTAIGENVFVKKGLTSVDIPSSVTAIGAGSFYNNALSAVTLPVGLTSLGAHAFSNNRLTTVAIPSGVTALNTGVFASNKLASVSIPNGVTAIAAAAFQSNLLTSLILPDSVTTIGVGSFLNNHLASVSIGNGVTAIGAAAFEHNFLTSQILPDTVTAIGASAFQDNLLTSIDLPDTVTSIGAWSFSSNELTTVAIPSGLTILDHGVFANNPLESVSIPNGVTTIMGSAFQNDFLTSLTLPASLTVIGEHAFDGNDLTSVQFLGAVPAQACACTFGSTEGILISFFARFGSDVVNGGFTTPTWNDYPTQALVAVDYNTTGGSTAPAATNVIAGGTLTTPTPPTWTGHAFTGWFTAASDGTLWDFGAGTVSADMTLYAQWTLNSYTVTFEPGSGAEATTAAVSYGDLATTPTLPEWPGHTLTGWFTASSGGTAWDFGTDTISASTTLYAQWTVNQYTVTFEPGNSDASSTVTVAYGSPVSAPTPPTWAGHTFTGWFVLASGGPEWDFDGGLISGDQTLHAQWSLNPYTVTFEPGNGGAATSSTAIPGGTVAAPSAPVWVGHTLTGWFTSAKAGTRWVFGTSTVSADTTLYAHWSVDSCTRHGWWTRSFWRHWTSPSTLNRAVGEWIGRAGHLLHGQCHWRL